jgi:hypothetical protein
MAKDVKQRAILYLGLAALLTILIAGSIARAQFRPGLPMPMTDGQSFAVAMEKLPEIKFQVNTFFFVLFSFFFLVLLLFTLYRLMQGTSWKRLALDFFLYTLVALVAFGAFALLIAALPRSTGVAQLPTQLPDKVVAPLGPTPPLLLWLGGFVLLVGLVVLGGGFVLARQRPGGGHRKISLLEAEALKARQALLDGQEVKDVILNCYQQMCLALQQEKGVERLVFMTTGDFERLLLDKGYPYEPIHRLTGLFEAVRYGHWQSGRRDEQTAITCLEAIIHYEGRQAKIK